MPRSTGLRKAPGYAFPRHKHYSDPEQQEGDGAGLGNGIKIYSPGAIRCTMRSVKIARRAVVKRIVGQVVDLKIPTPGVRPDIPGELVGGRIETA